MTCIHQYYTKHMIIYLLVACLFQVGGGHAATDPQSISVDVPDASDLSYDTSGTSYVGSLLGRLTGRAKSMANRVASAYSDSAEVATESGKNMLGFLQRMNESAVNFGTNAANRMGQIVKNSSQGWSDLLSGIFSRQ
ncbi:hypothetical protein ACI65C_005192 [Semiaphis heraclei]